MKYIALITSLLTSLTGQTQVALSAKNSTSLDKTGSQIDAALSEFEMRQRLISRVLQKNQVKPELFGTYKSSLLKIAAQSSDVQKWLENVDRYLGSHEFRSRTPQLQSEELADNRLLIQMTIKTLA